VGLHGLLGREAATGRGVVMALAELLQTLKRPLRGTRLAIQGFGNVGTHAAEIAAAQGATIVAVSDQGGTVSDPEGLDVAGVVAHKARTGTVKGFRGADSLASEALVTIDCDVLIPAALGDSINSDNMREIRAGIIVEGANGPISCEADEYLTKKGVTILPDIYANAGGVTASYFEWVQNIQQFRWSEEQVNTTLQQQMSRAYRDLLAVRQKHQTDFRTAAFALAMERVRVATLQRGVL
jgi:glutamate dehydrogenase (NAD(P)+)